MMRIKEVVFFNVFPEQRENKRVGVGEDERRGVLVLVLGANYVLLSNQRSPAINFPPAQTANMVTPPSLPPSLKSSGHSPARPGQIDVTGVPSVCRGNQCECFVIPYVSKLFTLDQSI